MVSEPDTGRCASKDAGPPRVGLQDPTLVGEPNTGWCANEDAAPQVGEEREQSIPYKSVETLCSRRVLKP